MPLISSLPSLPPELWALIINTTIAIEKTSFVDKFQSARALYPLALTCHMLADLCRPHIFHTFSMLWRPSEGHFLFEKFYTLLFYNPHIRPHVRRVEIHHNSWRQAGPKAGILSCDDEFLPKFLDVDFLPNLTHLSIAASHGPVEWREMSLGVQDRLMELVETRRLMSLSLDEIKSIPAAFFRACRGLESLHIGTCTTAEESSNAENTDGSDTAAGSLGPSSESPEENSKSLTHLSLAEPDSQLLNILFRRVHRPRLVSLVMSFASGSMFEQVWSFVDELFLTLEKLDLREGVAFVDSFFSDSAVNPSVSPISCSFPSRDIGPLDVFPSLGVLKEFSVSLMIHSLPPPLPSHGPRPTLEDLRGWHPFSDFCHLFSNAPKSLQKIHITLDFTMLWRIQTEMIFDDPVTDWFYGPKRTLLWPELDDVLSNKQQLPQLQAFELTIVLDDPSNDLSVDGELDEADDERDEFADHLSALLDKRLVLTKKRVRSWKVEIVFGD